MTLKLQKTTPIDLVGGSQEPSPTVDAPSKPKVPRVLIRSPVSTGFRRFPSQLCIQPTFERLPGLRGTNVAFPPPSFNLESPACLKLVFVYAEELVEVHLL